MIDFGFFASINTAVIMTKVGQFTPPKGEKRRAFKAIVFFCKISRKWVFLNMFGNLQFCNSH